MKCSKHSQKSNSGRIIPGLFLDYSWTMKCSKHSQKSSSGRIIPGLFPDYYWTIRKIHTRKYGKTVHRLNYSFCPLHYSFFRLNCSFSCLNYSFFRFNCSFFRLNYSFFRLPLFPFFRGPPGCNSSGPKNTFCGKLIGTFTQREYGR